MKGLAKACRPASGRLRYVISIMSKSICPLITLEDMNRYGCCHLGAYLCLGLVLILGLTSLVVIVSIFEASFGCLVDKCR